VGKKKLLTEKENFCNAAPALLFFSDTSSSRTRDYAAQVSVKKNTSATEIRGDSREKTFKSKEAKQKLNQ